VSKSGEIRECESRLLRCSFCKPDGKVGKETLANLSALRAAAADPVEAVLKVARSVDAGSALAVGRSRAHGHVALVHAAAQPLGRPGLRAGPGLCADCLAGNGAEDEAGRRWPGGMT
jgi:hypothetical protein